MTESTLIYQLQLLVDVQVVHEVTDQLLTFDEPLVFTVHSVKAYHAKQTLASTSEQVSGHSQKVRIDVLVNEQNYEAIIQRAKAPLYNNVMAFQLLPVFKSGTC
jgi:hypothetical protein